MASVIQLKRGTASAWTSANPVLAAGEAGFETDTKKIKVGDGTTAWNSLSYLATDGDISAVTAGTGLSGGGSSGSVTLNLDTTSQYVVPSQTGNSGKYLTTNGTSSSWGTITSYSAPTLGTTSITSGATVTTVEALTLKHSQLISPKEKVNVVASAPGAFITLYADTAGVHYYTVNTNTNFGVTFDFSASFDLGSKLATGESISFVLLVTNGATAYYPTSHFVALTQVTPKWQGGTAPTSGNANSIDAYSYTIVKTASNTYTVLASQVKFA